MDLKTYIKMCCVKCGDINITELANRTGISRQNICNKSAKNKFSNEDLEKIAEALNCTLEIRFIDKETGKPVI